MKPTDQHHKNMSILEKAEAIAHLGHWSWDPATQIVTWSPGCFNIFGRDRYTWVPTGENFRQDMPAEDRKKLEEANARGFESAVPFEVEYRRVVRSPSLLITNRLQMSYLGQFFPFVATVESGRSRSNFGSADAGAVGCLHPAADAN